LRRGGGGGGGGGGHSGSTPWLGKQHQHEHQQQVQAQAQAQAQAEVQRGQGEGSGHHRGTKEEQHLQMCSLTMGGAPPPSSQAPQPLPSTPMPTLSRLDSGAGLQPGMGMGGPVGLPMGGQHPLAGLGMSVGGGLCLAGMGLGSLASMSSFPSMGRIQSEDQLFLFRPRSLLQLEQQLLEHQADLEAQEETGEQ